MLIYYLSNVLVQQVDAIFEMKSLSPWVQWESVRENRTKQTFVLQEN